MAKIGRLLRPIAYDTDMNLPIAANAARLPRYNIVRARTILYAVIIAGGRRHHALCAGDARDDFGISVIHDRNPISVRLTDGAVRNGYKRGVSSTNPLDIGQYSVALKSPGFPVLVIQIIGAADADVGRGASGRRWVPICTRRASRAGHRARQDRGSPFRADRFRAHLTSLPGGVG